MTTEQAAVTHEQAIAAVVNAWQAWKDWLPLPPDDAVADFDTIVCLMDQLSVLRQYFELPASIEEPDESTPTAYPNPGA